MVAEGYYSRRNRISLVRNGPSFIDTCCRMIESAEQKIFFHTYAFSHDEATQDFVEALIRKSQQGVHVFVIVDAIGSSDISPQLKKRFKRAGIRFGYFAPLVSKRLENVGRRLHQKCLVVDNHLALVGGINHSRHFIKPKDAEPWLDYAALVEGEEVFRLQHKIKQIYFKCFPSERELIEGLIEKPEVPLGYGDQVRANVNDFMRFKSEIYGSYIRAIRQSKNKITIFATYFLPGKALLRELKRAIKRDVRVELIFSAYSDHPSERWSSKYLYSWYLKRGIDVYEWDKSIVHGKVALIDDQWVTLGSYNHNFLSRYVSLELNLEVVSEQFSREVLGEMQSIIKNCRKIDQKKWRSSTSRAKLFLYFFSYSLANVASLLSTMILVRKKKPKRK